MNNNEIKQRLIRAALTEDVPSTPSFKFPQPHKRPSRWLGYASVAAAACLVVAIVLPLTLHHSTEKSYAESTLATDDAVQELEEVFTMIDEHFSSSTDLISLVQ